MEKLADQRGSARIVEPNRRQLFLETRDLDRLLPPDHLARAVWEFVKGLDLSRLYAEIKSVEGDVGRPATDPAVLVALWLYASVDGVGSARKVDRLCREHDAYRWICGGVPMNYHTLADARTKAGGFADELLISSLAALMHAGVVDVTRVAQDGLKVRASAGAGSFHREEKLVALVAASEERIKQLRKDLEQGDNAASPGEKAARERAAVERRDRLKAALDAIPGIREQRRKNDRRPQADREPPAPDGDDGTPGPGEPDPTPPSPKPAEQATGSEPPASSVVLPDVPDSQDSASVEASGVMSRGPRNDGKREVRASTTDVDARVMKMSDGGYRPAFNVQVVTAIGGAVLAFFVTNSGADQPHLEPMVAKFRSLFGTLPKDWLADGGFVNIAVIDRLESAGLRLCMPPPKPRKELRSRYEPAPKDPLSVAAWRQRMGTEEARKLYEKRGATAELTNAVLRNNGLTKLMVRGVERAKGVVLMHLMAVNMMRTIAISYV
jgi:transposase